MTPPKLTSSQVRKNMTASPAIKPVKRRGKACSHSRNSRNTGEPKLTRKLSKSPVKGCILGSPARGTIMSIKRKISQSRRDGARKAAGMGSPHLLAIRHIVYNEYYIQ